MKKLSNEALLVFQKLLNKLNELPLDAEILITIEAKTVEEKGFLVEIRLLDDIKILSKFYPNISISYKYDALRSIITLVEVRFIALTDPFRITATVVPYSVLGDDETVGIKMAIEFIANDKIEIDEKTLKSNVVFSISFLLDIGDKFKL